MFNLTDNNQKILLSNWVLSSVKVDSGVIFEYVKEGKFDFADQKVKYDDFSISHLFQELLYLYFYLVDLFLTQTSPNDRNELIDWVIRDVIYKLGAEKLLAVSDWNKFSDSYNAKMQEFSQYKILLADPSKGEKNGDSLFFMAAKKISEVITGFEGNIIATMTIKSLLVHRFGSLWSLNN